MRQEGRQDPPSLTACPQFTQKGQTPLGGLPGAAPGTPAAPSSPRPPPALSTKPGCACAGASCELPLKGTVMANYTKAKEG